MQKVEVLRRFEIEKFVEEVEDSEILERVKKLSRFATGSPETVVINLEDNSLLIVKNAIEAMDYIYTQSQEAIVVTTVNGKLESQNVRVPEFFRVKGTVLRSPVLGD